MAYDKIIPIKSRLDHRINYALNKDKTGLSRVLGYIENEDKTTLPGGEVVFESALNCSLDAAFAAMTQTKERWHKPGGVLGYHLIHSYAPGEVTPEEAHAAGVEFARRLLGDRYEAVIATHLDHEHLHCHIVFNSVSFVDGKKYRNNFKDYLHAQLFLGGLAGLRKLLQYGAGIQNDLANSLSGGGILQDTADIPLNFLYVPDRFGGIAQLHSRSSSRR